MWRYLTSLAALVWSAAAPAQETAPAPAVEAFLEDAMPRAAAPGVAYALLEGEVLFLGARGERLQGSGEAVSADTPFLLGSISKSFTALAILQQVEAGHIALDRGIGAYLDAFADQPAGAITVRQLLGHTSGFSTVQGNTAHEGGDAGADVLAARVDQLARTAPAGAPGQRWAYSNANYLILGRLIEQVSGQSYQAYVETQILAPLGMQASFVADGAVHADIATGHAPWFGGRRALTDTPTSRAMAPAGGVVSSAADMARYLAMMVNGADDLITAEHKALMLAPVDEATPFYGLGWFRDPATGVAYHTGLSPGVETLAILSPAERRAGVVLVNANSGMGLGVTGDILAGFGALAQGETPAPAGPHFGTLSLYGMALVLPVIFLAGIGLAWRGRDRLRAKLHPPARAFGLFSLIFPLVATLAMAWVFLDLMPKLFGAPLGTFRLYQPDMVILLVASSVTGVGFAIVRLGLALGGRR